MSKKLASRLFPVAFFVAPALFIAHAVIASDYSGLVEFQVSPTSGVTLKLDGRPTSQPDSEDPSSSPAR